MPELTLEHSVAVVAHGFDFRPCWWQRPTVPTDWSSSLSDLPEAEQGRQYHHVSRVDLLTAHQDSSPDGCGRLLLACYAWGTGGEGWLVGRRARVFRDTPRSVLGKRLATARQILQAEGPAAAYTALHDGGTLRTMWMRASFFTKYLYAADAPGDGSCGRALILDQFVAISLNDLHGWGLRETGPWKPGTYHRWLDHAHALANLESERTGTLVRPDAIEMAYFKYGRHVWRARKGR